MRATVLKLVLYVIDPPASAFAKASVDEPSLLRNQVMLPGMKQRIEMPR